jgi:UDP-N-acetylmuramoyl-tripeptide--D-alanyl-D-alanine ligase
MKIKLGLGKMNMRDVAAFCGGELYDYTGELGCDFEYVCTDSREADEKTLFFATRGERVDGHDYIVNALDAGCRCVLCEYVPTDISGRCAAFVTVENSVDSFATLARGYREQKPLATVAITGSVGKTTTKELTASIMKRFLKLYYTEGNFNSVIGMPMSLMAAEQDKVAAVFEMGMSGFGEIRSMTRTARPRVAMVTNIGSSHLEYLKTRENIAKAKLEIAEGIRDGGYLLLNGDEPLLRSARHIKSKNFTTLYVGLDGKNDCQISAKNVRVGNRETVFDLYFLDKIYRDVVVSGVGAHFALNACFAAGAAFLLGADEKSVREGLADYTPSGMRQNIYEKNGITVIEDCYNAAPESVRCALDTLSGLDIDGKRIAVLGDMRELGDGSDAMHRDIGKYVAAKGIDVLLTLGRSASLIAEGAINAGMAADCVFAELDADGIDRLCAELAGRLGDGDAVLFKASRAMKLERVIEKIF